MTVQASLDTGSRCQLKLCVFCDCVSKKVISTSLGSLRMVMPVWLCLSVSYLCVFLCTFSCDIDIVTILAHKAQTSAQANASVVYSMFLFTVRWGIGACYFALIQR